MRTPLNDSIGNFIMAAIHSEINEMVTKEVKEATSVIESRISKNIDRIVATVSLHVSQRMSVETLGSEILIRIRKEGTNAPTNN